MLNLACILSQSLKKMLGTNTKNLWFRILFSLLATGFFTPQATALTVAKSDILLHIVSQCLDPSKENYCSQCMLPRGDTHCGDMAQCKQTNEVWAFNPDYAAIRDIKMCGCSADFVHGLAIPRDIVTGVEDSNRQEGIWEFAWGVAIERIEADSIALVVNPKSQRTQNQLHIHLVRLDKNARILFAQYLPVYVDNLKHIWSIAERDARAKGMNEYGVLVAQSSTGKYMVVVTANSPESAFTQWSCN